MSPDLWCCYSWFKSGIPRKWGFHIPSGGSLFNLFFIFPSGVLSDFHLPFDWSYSRAPGYIHEIIFENSSQLGVSLLRKIKVDKSVSLGAGGVRFVPRRKDLLSQTKMTRLDRRCSCFAFASQPWVCGHWRSRHFDLAPWREPSSFPSATVSRLPPLPLTAHCICLMYIHVT